ncbi:MAG: hypothetical protein C4346_18240 [Chloroflexota bacterium]
MEITTAAEQARERLRAVLSPDDFDVTVEDGQAIEIATDDWTLRIEGWPEGAGWFAIDEEPDDQAGYARARRAVMSEAVERALADIDRLLGGVIVRSLLASGDPFSQDFAQVLQRFQS